MRHIVSTIALAAVIAAFAGGVQAADQSAAAQPQPVIFTPWGPVVAAQTAAFDVAAWQKAQDQFVARWREQDDKLRQFAADRFAGKADSFRKAWEDRDRAARALFEAQAQLHQATFRHRPLHFGQAPEAYDPEADFTAFKAVAEKQRDAQRALAEADRALSEASTGFDRKEMDQAHQHRTKWMHDLMGNQRKAAEDHRKRMEDWMTQRRNAFLNRPVPAAKAADKKVEG